MVNENIFESCLLTTICCSTAVMRRLNKFTLVREREREREKENQSDLTYDVPRVALSGTEGWYQVGHDYCK